MLAFDWLRVRVISGGLPSWFSTSFSVLRRLFESPRHTASSLIGCGLDLILICRGVFTVSRGTRASWYMGVLY